MALVAGYLEVVDANGAAKRVRGFWDDAFSPQRFVAEHIVTATADLDPIFDEANAVRTASVTASTTVITPTAGCKYVRLVASGDCFVRTDAGTPADASGSMPLYGRTPEVVPVTAGTPVKVFATSAVTVYATPLKARP